MKSEKQSKTHQNPLKKLNELRKKLALVIGTFVLTNLTIASTAFAAGGGTLNELIGFFATWIGRIGGVIALVGAIMFGFAQKSEDAEGKQRAVNTMVSGIIVFAVCQAADWFTNLA